MYYDYYKSPIGIIKVVSEEELLTEVYFVKEIFDKTVPNHITDITVKQLDEYFKGNRKVFDIPLKIDGTEFQKDCYRALLEIPYGVVRSYKEQAQSIGRDKAYRAVGNANNKNKIGIIIPCHRVIGSNKSLVGYAGGLDKKEYLLMLEQGVIK